jgi:hypothetical protein
VAVAETPAAPAPAATTPAAPTTTAATTPAPNGRGGGRGQNQQGGRGQNQPATGRGAAANNGRPSLLGA